MPSCLTSGLFVMLRPTRVPSSRLSRSCLGTSQLWRYCLYLFSHVIALIFDVRHLRGDLKPFLPCCFSAGEWLYIQRGEQAETFTHYVDLVGRT